MKFGNEFKEFAIRGNVLDLAIGVVIGAAFSTIVTSLISDIITPLILNPSLEAAHLSNLEDLHWMGMKYGKFLSAIITFILTAFALFIVVKAANRMKQKQEDVSAPPTIEITPTEILLAEIRDELRKK